MADINHVTIVGRLTRDMEIAYSKNNSFPIGKMSIAINRRRKNGTDWVDEANFFDVTWISTGAEKLKPYLLKGKQVGIEGSLVQDRWEKDGQKFSKVYIMASNIQLLGSSSGTSTTGTSQGFAPRSAANSSVAPQEYDSSSFDNQSFSSDGNSFPEDIPF
jgi:single-strand DNA-binding protein